jgi:leader peptidase (prepilin peptidase)/N-methyltransferase
MVGTVLAGAVGLGGGLAAYRFVAAGGHRVADDTRPPRRLVWVPAASAVLATIAGWRLDDLPLIVPLTVAMAVVVLVALAAIDLDVHRLPRLLTWPAYPTFAVLLALCSWRSDDWAALGRAGQAAAASWLFFYVLHRLSRRSLGRGDVTLAGLLGLLLGWFGWSAVLVGLYAAFLLAGVAAGLLLLTRRATRRSRIAFGPAMVAGALLVLLA